METKIQSDEKPIITLIVCDIDKDYFIDSSDLSDSSDEEIESFKIESIKINSSEKESYETKRDSTDFILKEIINE